MDLMTPFNIGLWSMYMFIVKMLLMFSMGFDDEGDFESDGIYAVLSINKVLSFFMGMGFSHNELNSYWLSIPIGLAFSILYHFVIKKVRKMSNSVDIKIITPKQGDLVKVYSRITQNSGIIIWQGREFNALSNANEEFGLNDLVKVTNFINSTVYVEKF